VLLTALATAILLLTGLPAPPVSAASGRNAAIAAATPNGSWTAYHHDDAHAGNDSSQPPLVAVGTGWVSATLDEQVYAEPLVVNGIVYVVTLNNSVYALDQSSGAVVWSVSLGTPVSGGWGCGNVSPQGILGTPVIDVAGGRIYVAALFNSDHAYHVYGLSLTTGATQMNTTISISGFDWTIEQERGALALGNGLVYVPFGGRDGDCGNYHAYLAGVPTNGSTSIAFYQTPSSGSGMWGAGGPVIDDATGNVFATTGNAVGSGCDGTINQNDAVVRLNPTTLALADYFMPQDFQNNWCGNDQDLGSAGPLLISPSLLFQAGKHGAGFLLNPNSLGGVDGQVFPTPKPATYAEAQVCHGNTSDATFGSFAYAAPFVYLSCNGHGLVALNVNTGAPSFTPCGSTCAAPDWSAGGSLSFGPPIVAGGAVWVVDTGGTSGLYAFDASSGAQLFHSAGFGTHHFVTPSEAGGQVFVPAGNVIRTYTMATGVTFTPAQADFNGLAPTTTSAPQTVTLRNSQPTTLTISSVAVTGGNAADYTKGTDTCSGATVAASGGTCTVQVSFRPPSLGGFPASLTFTDNAGTSPQNVALDGMGALDNQAHLYTLDRFGGLHADGTAPAMAASAYWAGWNIARGAALFPDGTGGYTLDGYGGLHPFGSAPTVAPPAYWAGWDIARGVALAPWSTSSAAAGWTLDGYGGIHPFGGAPAVGGYSYFGFDIARGLAILPDSTPSSVAGYTLDGYGGIHPFGGAPAVANNSYWPGWDIAHSFTLSPNASKLNGAGWTLDGFGGVHPFGTAPSQAASGYWPGWDIARGIVAWTGTGTGGWVTDAWGGLHPFGPAPTVSPFSYWPGSNLAASLAGPGFSSGARAT
jgi:outer membrane protein assembly factor BamB